MKYPFVVILKKTGQRATDVISALLCLLSIFSFAFIAIQDRERILGTIALVLLLGLVAVFLWSRRSGKLRFRYLLLLAAMGWMFFTSAPWVGFFFLLLTFLEFQTKRPLEVGFDYDRVVINSLIKQEFEWSAFTNVILKDGLLTLDFKSNRLIQREIADDDEDDDADEDEFNAWCRQRLSGGENERR